MLSYVFDNPAGPHPEFDSSETFRAHRVIKYADRACLEFLTGSVAKISDVFVDVKLRPIPAKDIASYSLLAAPSRRVRQEDPAVHQAAKQVFTWYIQLAADKRGEIQQSQQKNSSGHMREVDRGSIDS